MFTYQSPQINQALWLSGMSNQSVVAFQNLVGQCRAPLAHRGPVQFDYTRPEMRLITPESPPQYKKDEPFEEPQNFPEQPEEFPEEPVMPPGTDPGRRFEPPEHRRDDPPPRDNDGPGDGFRPRDLTAGPYIRIENNVISLRNNDSRRHCVFPHGLNANDVVHSIDFETKNTQPDYIELTIKDNPRDTLWKLDVKNLEQIDIVTSVELNLASATPSLVFHKKSAWVFKPEDIASDSIEISACTESMP